MIEKKINEQKTLHKKAINQVNQCESEQQEIETTSIVATHYSKAWATTLTGYIFRAIFAEKKVPCSQVSNGNKNRPNQKSFYQSNIVKIIDPNPEDCKKELQRLKLTTNKGTNRKLINFQVFPDSQTLHIKQNLKDIKVTKN